MTDRVYRIGKGHGIKDIVEAAKKVYQIEKDSDVVKRILHEWSWARQSGGNKSAKLDRIEKMIGQTLANQVILFAIASDTAGPEELEAMDAAIKNSYNLK